MSLRFCAYGLNKSDVDIDELVRTRSGVDDSLDQLSSRLDEALAQTKAAQTTETCTEVTWLGSVARSKRKKRKNKKKKRKKK